ncbi:hypothetical protein MSAN_00222400 [Mycena sanguinolenta]|uniref:Uncharacterized protein n=1 Tax=Mycena sanguinolenta TaxID=230812 RepID=A0A8H6ZFE3_9AGAR|nr:hypothetical protein MSAN_00222400 [Mycena sanguinolenta]
MSGSSSSTHAKQLENAHAFIRSGLGAPRRSSGARLQAPVSLNYRSARRQDDRGKDEFVGVLRYNLEKIFEKVTYLPSLDVIHGENAVVFHFKSDGMSKSGKKYDNEYMVTFHFSGENIIKLNEFVDSKYSSAYFGALRAEVESAQLHAAQVHAYTRCILYFVSCYHRMIWVN